MSSVMQRSLKPALLTLFVSVAITLSGCQLFASSGPQTITDPNNSFHFTVPGSWTATTSPGLITLYGDEEMPSVDAAIKDVPWVFVLSANASEEDLPTVLKNLAKARSENRKWKDVTFGKPVKATLGKALAYEMDLKATDDLKRKFEGKLLVARRGGKDVLVFAFTEPGSFKKASYEDLKKNFFWLIGSDDEMTATTTVDPKKSETKDIMKTKDE